VEEEPGRARDMWTVLKIKSGKIAERSPYFRELLFFVRYTLVYGGDEGLLRELEAAFRDPAYPLSLGREDELLLIEDVIVEMALEGAPRFRGTIIPGDIRQMAGLRPVLREGAVFEPPVVERLPLGFTVDSKGIRHPERQVALSFLPLGVELEIPERQWQPLRWNERNFVWVNGEAYEG